MPGGERLQLDEVRVCVSECLRELNQCGIIPRTVQDQCGPGWRENLTLTAPGAHPGGTVELSPTTDRFTP